MKKNLRLLSLMFLLILVLSACGYNNENNVDNLEEGKGEVQLAEEKEAEALTLNLEGGDWGYLSPYTHYSRGPGAYKMKLIFDSIMERGEDGLIPLLAESWDIDESGREYTFKIREGVL